MKKYEIEIIVCCSTGCISLGGQEIYDELVRCIKEYNLDTNVKVKPTGCHGFCQTGPRLLINPEGVLYVYLKKSDVKTIVEQHLIGGKIVEKLTYKDPVTKKTVQKRDDINFYKHQVSITTNNCGKINPEDINDYLAVGGYESLKKVLTMEPEQVIQEIKTSRLRGKGGAGFPTGLKWSFLAQETSTPKYLICNGDEGDPGAFMDRTIMESDPQSIVEGMIIGAYATGATSGFVYVRAEKPLAASRIAIAIEQARKHGYLGSNILNSGLNFDIQVRKGAGAFVCGEETALMSSILGNRGSPRPRPPYPAKSGLWGKPTNINNVKTWATIPKIIDMSAENYAKIGTADSSGTAILCLSGNINNAGLIEIPMGTTIRTVVYDIGGGCPNGKKFKAIQIGGPSGGCIPEQYLDVKMIDTQIDFKSITTLGAIMGSGGLIVLDESTCLVDMAHYFIKFTQNESCGKCVPCRIGTRKMLHILDKIIMGQGSYEDLDELESLAYTIKNASLCGLGQTAPNPIISTLKYFRDEYEAHIKGICPALVCKNLITYHISAEMCVGCGICAKNCSVNAITGELKKTFQIDTNLCIKCGLCFSACPKNAIYKKTGGK